MSPNRRRLLALALFALCLATGKACQPSEYCTSYTLDGREITITTADSRCAAAHRILDELRERDPGGNIIIP
jgi:hypothetical protein